MNRRVALVLAMTASAMFTLTAVRAQTPMTPSDPHERLALFIGTWTVTEWPPEERFLETCEWLASGRRHVVCRSSWIATSGPREGLSIFSYRPADATYVYQGFRPGGGTQTLHGKLSADGQAWEFGGDEGRGAERRRTQVRIVPVPDGGFLFTERSARGDSDDWAEESVHYERLPDEARYRATTTGDAVQSMAAAASKFLSALSAEQRARASFELASPDRTKWHFLPPEMFPRQGVTLRELDDGQRQVARELLKSGLSQRGYLAADAIMELEIVVRAIQSNRLRRDELEYFVSVFGTPEPKGSWGWRFEGHHLALNFTIVDGHVTVSTPTFAGANPAELREGPKAGQRPLGHHEDHARDLVRSLTGAQRTKALISDTALPDIVTMNAWPVAPLSPPGLTAAEMSAGQRTILETLIDSYTTLMAADISTTRWKRIRDADFDKIAFAWAGSTERGKPHYFRVQGPTFLIEYDNTQNDANHVHTVWREFDGDFGADLLRQHYVNDTKHMRDFATRYTAAWCGQNPAHVAAFFSESGSLKINDGEPSVGRGAITEAARSFMTAFPDMVVEMDALERRGDGYIYRWTLKGKNTGPGGTGAQVKISGYEQWTIGPDGLIAASLGHFDADDYDRQLRK